MKLKHLHLLLILLTITFSTPKSAIAQEATEEAAQLRAELALLKEKNE